LHIAVTGANGFVGRNLIRELVGRGHSVRALVRYPDAALANEPIEVIATGPIEAIEDWRPYLTGVEAVIHLAARAHLADRDMQDASLFRAVNTTATLALAKSAAKRKVSRFIYLSSIGVHGDETKTGIPFRAGSPFNPQTHYARSKAEAELGLRALHAEGAMEITVLRPPLIYGIGARGNFRALCELVKRAPALPFASINNLRSMVAVENLSSAICAGLEKQNTAFSSYVVCDGKDFSLPQLVTLIAQGMKKSCRLFPVPHFMLMQTAALFARKRQMRTLTQSLQVDDTDFRRDISWTNPVEPEIALRHAAAWLTNAFKPG
jgi:nucleoside-diphosphate-sugar epimerase